MRLDTHEGQNRSSQLAQLVIRLIKDNPFVYRTTMHSFQRRLMRRDFKPLQRGKRNGSHLETEVQYRVIAQTKHNLTWKIFRECVVPALHLPAPITRGSKGSRFRCKW
ncbi:hypothetical protein AVEN_156647-1 [Araneus ventricosus]|uniref:Uncharacterized protein n=1 Tax=Araneus ventricosus TaxID=182803 RepID=A0A4Y2KM57_ARAVE|nr:hypothetical protein AVEN_156647-1 [Araneus ventricosus]